MVKLSLIALLFFYQAAFAGSVVVGSAASPYVVNSGWHINAGLVGGNATMITTGVQATFIEMTNGSLTLTPQTGSAAVGAVCATTTAATTPSTSATTCSGGNESLGFSFTNPDTESYYDVCVDFMPYCVSSTGGKCQDAFQLIETPTDAQTLTLQGGNIQGFVSAATVIATGSGNIDGPVYHLCSTFKWSTVATRAIRLMYKSTITDTVSTHLIVADGGPITTTDRQVYFTVRRVP